MKAFRLYPVRAKARRVPRSSLSQLRRVHITHHEVTPKTWFMPTRQGIVHILDPKKATTDQIMRKLEALRPTAHIWRKHSYISRQAVIILATPSLASYLEDGSDFIPQLLKAINLPLPSEEIGLKVDVVCGCVDGLPPPVNHIPQARGRPILEGFSILYGETMDILPQYMLEKQDEILSKSEKPGSITFRRLEDGGMHVTLPLANTLFKNGRLSTLLASRWEPKGDVYAQIEPQVNISALSVNALGNREEGPPELYVPAIPLTYARELQDGYGNIIRSLKFQGIERLVAHPASSELEVKVPRFLKEALGKLSAIKIWALILPPHLVRKSTKGMESTIRLPDKRYKELYPLNDYKDVGHLIYRGATLCRVQSGGGGWGPKAGLLSLDPEKSYSNKAEAPLDLPEIFLDGDKFHGLDNIAKEGSYIQFFTSRESRAISDRLPQHYSSQPMKLATIIGTIPSSIDSLNREQTEADKIEALREQNRLVLSGDASRSFHQKVVELLQVPFLGPGRSETDPPQEEASSTSDATPEKEKAIVRPTTNSADLEAGTAKPETEMHVRKGEFGFVSESGMFVKQSGRGNIPRIKSKIDVPYSYIYKAFGKSGVKITKVVT